MIKAEKGSWMEEKKSYEALLKRVEELEEKEKKRRMIQENLRMKAAQILQRGIPKFAPETMDSIETLMNELQLYQVELEMQNEELRATQQELQASRDHFHSLFHKAPIGYVVLDHNGMITDANQAMEEMLGQARGELLKRPISQFITSQDRSIFISRFKAFFKSPEGKTISIRLENSQGDKRDVELKARIHIQNQNPSVKGTASHQEKAPEVILVSVLDVTLQMESNRREAHIKKVLTAIRKVDQLIVNATDPVQLMQAACEALTDNMGYYNAWIVRLDESQHFSLAASSGFKDELKIIEREIYRGHMPQCISHAIEQKEVVVTITPTQQCSGCPMVNRYTGQSGLTRCLFYQNKVFGAITVAVPKLYASDPEEHRLFDEVADDLGFALYKLDMDAQLHRYSHIFDTIPHPISFVSKQYRYQALNNAYLEYYPVTKKEEIIGKGPADFFGDDVFEQSVKPYLDRALSGERVQYEVEVTFPGQRGQCWMEMSYFPYRDEKGRIMGVVTHGLEITQLKRSEKRLRTILEGTPLGICITDKDGLFEYVNPSYCQLYDYVPEELIGNHFTMVVPEAYRTMLSELHDAFIQGEKELRGEWQVEDKNGCPITIMADASRIVGMDGHPRKVTFVMDISEKIEMERMKEDVDRMMRHDLKQPLNAIMGFPYVLESKGNLDPVQVKSVRMIKEAAETMLKMIDASLDMFKMEQGSYDYQPVSLNLLDLISRVMEGYRSIMATQNIHHTFLINGRPLKNEDALMVLSERHLMQSLLSNVIVNAIEASPNGGTIDIEITSIPSIIQIAIHNQGAVPKEMRKRFFDKYQTHGKKKGTGLGTYSAKLMADVMGYDIAMETSDMEDRTTISITIHHE